MIYESTAPPKIFESFSFGSIIFEARRSLFNSGLGSELAGNVRAFCKGLSTRVGSGTSYYGVFDLSGNVWELTVTVGRAEGRVFSGRYHGDGVLSLSGESDVSSWPSSHAAVGACFRGGGWTLDTTRARLSDRISAAVSDAARDINDGGRAPSSAWPFLRASRCSALI